MKITLERDGYLNKSREHNYIIYNEIIFNNLSNLKSASKNI